MPWHIVEGHSECPTSRSFAVVKDDDGSVQGCHASRDSAEDQLAALNASESSEHRGERAPIETRDAAGTVSGVNFAQRIIEVVAVPYEQVAVVPYRNELWHESFDRGSFDGIEKRPNRVRANRDHDKIRTVGKAVRFHPTREEGLISEVRIASTPLGDETLALADEEILDASIGFAVRNRDQDLDKANHRRRIRKAYLDHIAFTPDPAYTGSNVLDVRRGSEAPNAADLPKLVTPNLDKFTADESLRWASERLKK